MAFDSTFTDVSERVQRLADLLQSDPDKEPK
jgi:hypothetical protein